MTSIAKATVTVTPFSDIIALYNQIRHTCTVISKGNPRLFPILDYYSSNKGRTCLMYTDRDSLRFIVTYNYSEYII